MQANQTPSFAAGALDKDGPIEDDQIATSDEEFMSEYDEHPSTPGWSKPMTEAKQEFMRQLKELETMYGRDANMERQLLIYDYGERARFRRNYKAYERLVNMLSKELPIEEESRQLYAQELQDKMLHRPFYYAQDEPKVFVRRSFHFASIIQINLNCIFRRNCCRSGNEPSSENTSNTPSRRNSAKNLSNVCLSSSPKCQLNCRFNYLF